MPNTDPSSNKRIYFFALIGVLIVLTIYYFLQNTSQSTTAAAPKINFSFNPSSGSLTINQQKSTSILLQTGSSTQKISALNLLLKSTGPISIKDIAAPVAVDGGKLQTSQVTKKISANEARVVYTFFNPNATLPQAVTLELTYSGTAGGSGKIILDTANSQIVGPVPGNEYIWGKIGSAIFSVTK